MQTLGLKNPLNISTKENGMAAQNTKINQIIYIAKSMKNGTDKPQKLRKPAQWSPQTIVKREFIARTIKNFGNHILPRETKILNQLFETLTDSLEFWQSLELPFQLNSLAYLKQEKGWDLLQAEWKKFNFKPEERQKHEIGDINLFKKEVDSGGKIEENKEKTVNNIREMLKLW